MDINEIRRLSMEYDKGNMRTPNAALADVYHTTEYSPNHPGYADTLSSGHWKKLRKAAIAASGGACQQCGTKGVRLHAHHIHYRTFGRETLEDVRVLCFQCHLIADGQRAAENRLHPEKRFNLPIDLRTPAELQLSCNMKSKQSLQGNAQKKATLAVRLSPTVKRQVKIAAIDRQMTMEQFVEQALVDAIHGRRAPRDSRPRTIPEF